jgi:uncharacterized protein
MREESSAVSKQLKIAPNLSLPQEAVTQTFAILAKRGVGKTYTALVMVEEMLKAGLQVVVADPVGVCWGLRSSADGRRPGHPITVFGGERGDVPLEVAAGEVVADFLIESGQPAVLDLSLMRKGEQTRFMTDFAERLYHRNRRPLHLLLDEADAFAPQRPMKGQERMLGAVEDLVRRGRARGIGLTLVTQRSAVLNKDVLTQVEVLVALRTIAPQDRAAIDEWIKVHGTPAEREQLMSSLPSLPVGDAWFWSPGWLDLFKRVHVRQRETFDSSATPQVGSKPQAPRELAEVDLERLREKLAATIEKAKADDPRELRRRIAELDHKLRQAAVAEAKVERVEVPAVNSGQLMTLAEEVGRLEKSLTALAEITSSLKESIARVQPQRQAAPAGATRPTPQAGKSPAYYSENLPSRPTPVRKAQSQQPPKASANGHAGVQLRAGERKLLQVLAQRYPTKFTRAQLGTLAGFTPSGGTFGTYFGVLKRHGLLSDSGGEVTITEEGLNFLGSDRPPQPRTTEELLEMWGRALRAGERRLLDVLVEEYPDWIARERLGEVTGFTASGGTFGTYLGVLKRNGLVEVRGQEVRASDTLFID